MLFERTSNYFPNLQNTLHTSNFRKKTILHVGIGAIASVAIASLAYCWNLSNQLHVCQQQTSALAKKLHDAEQALIEEQRAIKMLSEIKRIVKQHMRNLKPIPPVEDYPECNKHLEKYQQIQKSCMQYERTDNQFLSYFECSMETIWQERNAFYMQFLCKLKIENTILLEHLDRNNF